MFGCWTGRSPGAAGRLVGMACWHFSMLMGVCCLLCGLLLLTSVTMKSGVVRSVNWICTDAGALGYHLAFSFRLTYRVYSVASVYNFPNETLLSTRHS